jgi:hypothetical protein
LLQKPCFSAVSLPLVNTIYFPQGFSIFLFSKHEVILMEYPSLIEAL